MRQGIEKRAVDTFGKLHQLIKSMEELGELQSAISRFLLHHCYARPDAEKLIDNLNEELADVIIMTEQIKRFILDETKVERYELEKLDRLNEILKVERLKNG
ncbi:MAG: hypothetical protein ACOCRO_11195 [Halanaerobiales bacterium]